MPAPLLTRRTQTELLLERCEQLNSLVRFLAEWLRAIERRHGSALVDACKPADVPAILKER